MVKKKLDIVDVHVTSNTVVDSFTQYPLLNGDKRYTVECTEFTSPLHTQSALPPLSFFQDDAGNTLQWFFEIRRKRRTEAHVPFGNINCSMTTLVTDPVGLFADGRLSKFRKSLPYPCSTIGELIYNLQLFFDDFKKVYMQNEEDLLEGFYHGGGDDIQINDDVRLVDVQISPNSTLSLILSPVFTKHFFLVFTDYGQKILGFPEIVAYRTDGQLLSGITALTDNNIDGLIIEGDSVQTVVLTSSYPLSRYFDHRVRLELETQIGIPASIVWSTSNVQQLNHVLATFPFNHKIKTTVSTDNKGVVVKDVRIQENILHGDLIFRRSENKISERYLLNNSKFFHNIRLEVFMVRRKWSATNKFLYKREKMVYNDAEHWTAKLRFRSIN